MADVLQTTGPHIFTRVVMEHIKQEPSPEHGVRLVCCDANGTCVYDVAGTHNKASYDMSGQLIKPRQMSHAWH